MSPFRVFTGSKGTKPECFSFSYWRVALNHPTEMFPAGLLESAYLVLMGGSVADAPKTLGDDQLRMHGCPLPYKFLESQRLANEVALAELQRMSCRE